MHDIPHIRGISIDDGVGIMKLGTKLAAVLGVLWATTGTVQAGAIADGNLDTPIIGGSFFVVADGNVFAEYLGSRAGYHKTLSFDGRNLFSKHSRPGSRLDLGSFSAGDELSFELFVLQTGSTFHSGAGDDNPDGMAHFRAITRATTTADGDGYLTSVGVEDQLGGGDLDFNDFMFSLTNVIDPPPATQEPSDVSEPPALFLLAVGLVGLLARRRRVA